MLRDDEDEESEDLGFMDFFDWLAQKTDEQLRHLANSILREDERRVVLGALSLDNRECAGLVIWQAM